MKKTYKTPPIIESVCEFVFGDENEHNQDQIDVFFNEIKDNFPIQKKGKLNKLEIHFDKNKTPEENKKSVNQSFYEFDQYFSDDEKYSVQLHEGKVSIHRIKPYTSWSDFSPLIKNVYNSYINTFLPKKIVRIGIRYINEIILPSDSFIFSDYFTIIASLPSLKDGNQKSIFLGSVFEQEEGRDAIKVQFAEKQLLKETSNKLFVLDLDYFLVEQTVPLDKVDEWIDIAHSNMENVFEGMITEKTKEFFDK